MSLSKRTECLLYLKKNLASWHQPDALGHHACVSHFGYSWCRNKVSEWILKNEQGDIINQADYDASNKSLAIHVKVGHLISEKKLRDAADKYDNILFKFYGDKTIPGGWFLSLFYNDEFNMSFVATLTDPVDKSEFKRIY